MFILDQGEIDGDPTNRRGASTKVAFVGTC